MGVYLYTSFGLKKSKFYVYYIIKPLELKNACFWEAVFIQSYKTIGKSFSANAEKLLFF